MIKIFLTEEDIKKLNYERFHHPHPHVQRKMEALWLKSRGIKHKDICRLTKISPNTLRNYIREYQQGGVVALKKIKFGGAKHVRLSYSDR